MFHGVLAHLSISDRNVSCVRPYVLNFSHFQFLLQKHYMPSHQAYHNCSSIFFRTTTCQATKLTTTVPLSSTEPLHAKPPSLPQLFLYVSLRATKLTTTVPLSSSEPLHAKPPSLPQLFLYLLQNHYMPSHQAYHNCSSVSLRSVHLSIFYLDIQLC